MQLFYAGENNATWGVVVRDECGELVMERGGEYVGVHNAFGAELQAMLKAVDVAADIGAIRVVFESDWELLAVALNRRGPYFSQLVASLDDLKVQVHSWFSSYNVQTCRRSANILAHELAQLGRFCNANEAISWDVDVPASITEYSVVDLPQFS
jgi:ribonuclease HI